MQQLMQPELEKHNINFSVSFIEELSINIDYTLIEQVLINLLVNAKDALVNTENPKINLDAITDQGKVFINVSDNGPGISKNQEEKIFTPFYTTKENGAGIGLSLSRQIMHLHDGNIMVKSVPYNRTTFMLKFLN